LIIPGLAAELKDDIEKVTGWPVEVGPVCAAELPCYFGDSWTT
jgi:CO dehydrogenase/acetyl-CoA synthase gamma subunit (corrinoid Fe-S protein)